MAQEGNEASMNQRAAKIINKLARYGIRKKSLKEMYYAHLDKRKVHRAYRTKLHELQRVRGVS